MLRSSRGGGGGVFQVTIVLDRVPHLEPSQPLIACCEIHDVLRVGHISRIRKLPLCNETYDIFNKYDEQRLFEKISKKEPCKVDFTYCFTQCYVLRGTLNLTEYYQFLANIFEKIQNNADLRNKFFDGFFKLRKTKEKVFFHKQLCVFTDFELYLNEYLFLNLSKMGGNIDFLRKWVGRQKSENSSRIHQIICNLQG